MTSPGASSVPAKSDPIITQSAPAAIALATSPENLIPPSAIMGTPAFEATSTQSTIAVICGTPAPVTTLVVQMLPGPIPILIASTPASIRAFAPSAVAIFPAMTWRPGNRFFTAVTAEMTLDECPCAVSTTIASTRASTSAAARSRKSPVAPIAAAQRSLPSSSFAALGYLIAFWMSFTVIRPFRWPSLSTTSSFSMRCSCNLPFASSRVVPIGTVTRG